jgi:hypothetical protein
MRRGLAFRLRSLTTRRIELGLRQRLKPEVAAAYREELQRRSEPSCTPSFRRGSWGGHTGPGSAS